MLTLKVSVFYSLVTIQNLLALSRSLQQNVLISPKGAPLLADFGLSVVLSQSKSVFGTTASVTRGTVRWMAKELFLSSNGEVPKHTTMTDIWAFGMIAYVRGVYLKNVLTVRQR